MSNVVNNELVLDLNADSGQSAPASYSPAGNKPHSDVGDERMTPAQSDKVLNDQDAKGGKGKTVTTYTQCPDCGGSIIGGECQDCGWKPPASNDEDEQSTENKLTVNEDSKKSIWRKLGELLGIVDNEDIPGLGRGNHGYQKRADYASRMSGSVDEAQKAVDTPTDEDKQKLATLHRQAEDAHTQAYHEAAEGRATGSSPDFAAAGMHIEKARYHRKAADDIDADLKAAKAELIGRKPPNSTNEEDATWLSYNREWPQHKRDKLDGKDFAGPERSFPIKTQADVDAAIHSIGRSKHDPDVIKAGIKRIAERKGLELPDSYEENCNKMTSNEWSEVAREAAAAARKAGGSAPSGDASDKANEATSKAQGMKPGAKQFRANMDAYRSHLDAASAHVKEAQTAGVSQKATRAHIEAARAHGDAANNHLKAFQGAGSTTNQETTAEELNMVLANAAGSKPSAFAWKATADAHKSGDPMDHAKASMAHEAAAKASHADDDHDTANEHQMQAQKHDTKALSAMKEGCTENKATKQIKLILNRQGEDMTLTDIQRTKLVEGLLTNCGGDAKKAVWNEEDRDHLTGLSDAKLIALARQNLAANAKDDGDGDDDPDDDDDDDEDEDDEDMEKNAGGDFHSFDGAQKGSSAQAGDKGTKDEYPDEKNLKVNSELVKFRKMFPNLYDGVAHLTSVANQNKVDMMKRIVANYRHKNDPKKLQAFKLKLANETMGSLQERLDSIPEQTQNRRRPEPEPVLNGLDPNDPLSVFLGAGTGGTGNGVTTTVNAENTIIGDDLPTLNAFQALREQDVDERVLNNLIKRNGQPATV